MSTHPPPLMNTRPCAHIARPNTPAHSPQLVSGGFFFTNSFFLQGGQCHRVRTSPHGQAPDVPTHGHDMPPHPHAPTPQPHGRTTCMGPRPRAHAHTH